MSRIPLRPTPAGADILELKTPPDWAKIFGREGPLELEIGCGAGGFALEYCRRNPHVNFIAFEWRKKYAREVAHRAEKHGYTGLKVVEGDAREMLPGIFAPGTVDQMHLQFPDPWWKRAHQKRAILQPEFTRFMLTLLKPNGRFDFRTDVEDVGVRGVKVLEEAGFHNPLGSLVFHPYDPEEAPSTRERRYIASGAPVYRARLVKK
ncbi:MAG: tRNA (guanosine(46)-N7)-methyltransferase TrmB [Archangium sp.]